jgi:hypothetical protein
MLANRIVRRIGTEVEVMAACLAYQGSDGE